MNTLSPLTVMVTRPSPQGEILSDILQQQGANPIFFPTIDIISLTDLPDFRHAVTQLHVFNWLIFISPQAVQQAAKYIHMCWPSFPGHVKIAAVGGGTVRALQQAHLPVHVSPPHHWNSEGLLALPDFQQIAQQKIALIRGEGGRTFLAEELTQRGAKLAHIIAYRRCLPTVDVHPYLKLLHVKKIDIIISTSCDILQNLIQLLGKMESKLYEVPLVVISAQMMSLAENRGFKTVLLAKNASHEAILAILKDHICQMKLKKN